MSQCIECARLDLKAADRMAARGFGCCRLKQKHEFVSVSYPRDCAGFEQAKAEIVSGRKEWFAAKENKKQGG